MVTDRDIPTISNSTPADYCVEVQGLLDESWSDVLGDMTIYLKQPSVEPVVTVLRGQLPDQAALAGMLNYIFLLGLPLLSVTCLGVGSEPEDQ